ncbi:MAG: universal stress protein [Owenweeksia sp.]|nr:universal stress protein [Owenweeksia sp.]
MNKLIKESGIGGDIRIHHLKGHPVDLIPNFIKENEIDILVMGTLARTGISGFIMGNTAENILQELGMFGVGPKNRMALFLPLKQIRHW